MKTSSSSTRASTRAAGFGGLRCPDRRPRVTTGEMVLRVAGYWLLYAVVGVLVVAMLAAGGGDLGSEDARSPIRGGTKVIGAVNGIAIGATALGAYLVTDARASASAAAGILYGGTALVLVFGVWAAVRIAGDLSRHRAARR
jgi:hypothetical protein